MKTLILIFSISLLISCTDNSQKSTTIESAEPIATTSEVLANNTPKIDYTHICTNELFMVDNNSPSVDEYDAVYKNSLL